VRLTFKSAPLVNFTRNSRFGSVRSSQILEPGRLRNDESGQISRVGRSLRLKEPKHPFAFRKRPHEVDNLAQGDYVDITLQEGFIAINAGSPHY
jgi:hypothetical protein